MSFPNEFGQEAVVKSAELNTLGIPLGVDTPRLQIVVEDVKTSLRTRKTLVYFFLAGGADTF